MPGLLAVPFKSTVLNIQITTLIHDNKRDKARHLWLMSLKSQTMESSIPHLTPPSSHLSHTSSLGGVKMRLKEMRRHVSIMKNTLCQREANRLHPKCWSLHPRLMTCRCVIAHARQLLNVQDGFFHFLITLLWPSNSSRCNMPASLFSLPHYEEGFK